MAMAVVALSTIAEPGPSRGRAFCTRKYAPRMLMANVSSKSSSLDWSKGTNLPTPALMKMTSRRPNRSRTAATSRSASGTDAASLCTTSASRPSSSCAVFNVLGSRPVMAILAPSALKARAVARPIPLLPPVMRTTFPSNWEVMSGSPI